MVTVGTDGTVNPPFIPDPCVFPRKPAKDHYPVIAIDSGRIMLERTGEVYGRDQLAALIVTEPSSLIVVHNVGRLVKELEDRLVDNPRWQFRAAPVEREVYAANRTLGLTQIDTVFAFLGFQGEERVSKRTGRLYRLPGHYHYPLDPSVFARATAIELRPDNTDELSALLQWGVDVRDWTKAQGVKVKPTAGGVAGQLLRDERFYPKARRKVPRFTNETAREQLPGNFYRLYSANVGQPYNATYLDQASSHHTIASEIALPHADYIHARGFYRDLDGHRVLCRNGTEAFEELCGGNHHGLLYANLAAPEFQKLSFELPFMGRQSGKTGYRRCFIYTNEIPYIRELGGIIDSVVAAWTSPMRDEGIPAYAQWAKYELAASNKNRRRWLKPTLLSTYGILAAKPRHVEFGFRRAKGGEEKVYHAGGEQLTVLAKRTEHTMETPTVNVIQRGMIEAETRLRSLRLARQLHLEYGATILAVYADSVFVQSDVQLPFLPAGWEVKGHLTNLVFYNATSFVSREIERLPGLSREHRERLARIRSWRAMARRSHSVRHAGRLSGVKQTTRKGHHNE